MAKEIVIWCEVDLADDKRVVGKEYELTVDGTTVTIDLCDECHERHLAPVKAFLSEFGQPVTKVRGPYKKAKRSDSEVSDSSPKYTANENGEYVCDDCGRAFSTPQGIGRHRVSHNPDALAVGA